MISSRAEFKRARPALGTLVQIGLSGMTHQTQLFDCESRLSEVSEVVPDRFSDLFLQAFVEVERLENILSYHSQQSDLSALNRAPLDTIHPVGSELFEVIKTAQRFCRESEGAFLPFTDPTPAMSHPRAMFHCLPYDSLELGEHGGMSVIKRSLVDIDLGGIAKGAIVDRIVSLLQQSTGTERPHSGVVNAGGDMRFFSHGDRSRPHQVFIRLGGPNAPFLRELHTVRDAVATSSGFGRLLNSASSTSLRGIEKPSFSEDFTIVALSDTCCTADALTKIARFAKPALTQAIVLAYQSEIIIFDDQGHVAKMFGASES